MIEVLLFLENCGRGFSLLLEQVGESLLPLGGRGWVLTISCEKEFSKTGMENERVLCV